LLETKREAYWQLAAFFILIKMRTYKLNLG